MKLLITTLTMIFISFGANSKSFELFSVNECVDIYMEGKEALKDIKNIVFKPDNQKTHIYLKASALSNLYQAFCKTE